MSIYNNLYSRRAPGFTPVPEKGDKCDIRAILMLKKNMVFVSLPSTDGKNYALHIHAITAKNLEESLLLFVVVMLENNEFKWRNIRRNIFVQESGTEIQQLNMVDMSSEEGLILKKKMGSIEDRDIYSFPHLLLQLLTMVLRTVCCGSLVNDLYQLNLHTSSTSQEVNVANPTTSTLKILDTYMIARPGKENEHRETGIGRKELSAGVQHNLPHLMTSEPETKCRGSLAKELYQLNLHTSSTSRGAKAANPTTNTLKILDTYTIARPGKKKKVTNTISWPPRIRLFKD
ncbi:unnamed protein product [Caenorhabditis nigoni]